LCDEFMVCFSAHPLVVERIWMGEEARSKEQEVRSIAV
jgi:hypothetical protein